jgi:hypothetical protein
VQFVADKVAMGQVFSPSIVGFPCHFIGAAFSYFHLPGALCSPNMNNITK